MKIRSLFPVSSDVVSLSLRELLDALRRLLFPRPIPVRVENRKFVTARTVAVLLTTAMVAVSCAKKDPKAATKEDQGTDRISLHAKPLPRPTGSGESAGGGSPLGQQMVAQKIVEDMSGGTDIRVGRKAAAQIDAINAKRKAEFEEMDK